MSEKLIIDEREGDKPEKQNEAIEDSEKSTYLNIEMEGIDFNRVKVSSEFDDFYKEDRIEFQNKMQEDLRSIPSANLRKLAFLGLLKDSDLRLFNPGEIDIFSESELKDAKIYELDGELSTYIHFGLLEALVRQISIRSTPNDKGPVELPSWFDLSFNDLKKNGLNGFFHTTT